ncbi:hypothetical protein CEXT_712731 [Caerostris extrusa]|uniref:Uncharacterized protein n=1 Tax=Caerostris extrusa TaxID=172846 RepID=A0AAV4SI31_CAEEX|nr:hypothetical protein CEXT_712731 [Caerostris extrusa]
MCNASKIVDLIFSTACKIDEDDSLRRNVLLKLTLESLKSKQRRMRKRRHKLKLKNKKAFRQTKIDQSQLPKDGDSLGLDNFSSDIKSIAVSDKSEEKMA